jgi:hypothetical protein
MEKTPLINDFFTAIIDDYRITPAHISVYMALCHLDAEHEGTGQIFIFSRQIMPLAKVSSSATYRKCIRDLDEFGYIDYTPSFSCILGSMVRLGKSNSAFTKRLKPAK